MAKGKYLSTGEAAKVLNISRSTVSRRFDVGLFQGKLNPITGERLISMDSVQEFIREHQLPIDSSLFSQKSVILGSADKRLGSAIDKVLGRDGRVALSVCHLGTDTLVACSRSAPHLLILDERLPDLACSQVIGTLRKQEEHRQLRILCVLDKTPAKEAEAWGADACMKVGDETRQEEFADTLYRHLGLTRDVAQPAGPREHSRAHSRVPVRIPADIGIYRLSDPHDCAWGRAMVQNISEGGAFLSKIHVSGNVLPAEPFRILMKIDHDPLHEWQADCQMVRLNGEDGLNAGVKFVKISRSDRQQVAELSAA